MKKKERDVFDRIMEVKLFSAFQPLYKKYKEILLYLFFGGLSFFVSIGSYALFERGFGWNPLIANLFSWILAIVFAYVTNRMWVFDNSADDLKGVFREVVIFFGGRIFTLIVEEIILYIGVIILEYNSIVTKTVGQIIVIILNYFISKIIVFNADV